MKTKIQYLMAVTIASFFALLSASAQINSNAPLNLPIGSVDELRGYAVKSVAHSYFSAGSQSTIWNAPGSKTFFEKEFHRFLPSDGTNWINSLEAVFYLYNTNDIGFANAQFVDKTGWPLFTAQAQTDLIGSGANLHFRTPNLLIQMNTEIPIYIPNVQWGEINILDDDGHVVQLFSIIPSEYDSSEGRILFPGNFADPNKKGQFVLHFKNGTSAAYRIGKGNQIPLMRATQKFQSEFEGTRTFVMTNFADTAYTYVTLDEYDANISPTSIVDMLSTNAFTYLYIACVLPSLPGQGYIYADKAYIRNYDSDISVPAMELDIPSAGYLALTNLPVGRYIVWYHTSHDAFGNPFPRPTPIAQ